jgi:hypothetical protein
MPSAKVIVTDDFPKLMRGYERGVKRALGHAAAVTIASARSQPVEYQIGPILNTIKATPAHTTRKGWRIIVYAADYKAIFYERGTYSRRRGKLKRARTAKAEAIAARRGSGVKAQHFLARAAKAGRLALIRFVSSEFR